MGHAGAGGKFLSCYNGLVDNVNLSESFDTLANSIPALFSRIIQIMCSQKQCQLSTNTLQKLAA